MNAYNEKRKPSESRNLCSILGIRKRKGKATNNRFKRQDNSDVGCRDRQGIAFQEKYIKLAMLAWRGLNPRLYASRVPST